MKKNVIWNYRAEADYWKNIDYLLTHWTVTEAQNFVAKVDHLIEQLESGNLTFKRSDYKNIFVVPVVPQIKLFYHNFSDDTIELLRFRSSRKNPETLRF
jgi:plasmid stabilization system protein ParE